MPLDHGFGRRFESRDRQRSPKNAVEIARILLEAGAEVDALAGMYGGRCTTMSMLVSSTPPARAGVQVPLVEILIDHGAPVGPSGTGDWTSPVTTALVFGFRDAAEALVRRGARIDTPSSGCCRSTRCREAAGRAGRQARHQGHDLYQGTPLGWAEYMGKKEIAEYLRDVAEV